MLFCYIENYLLLKTNNCFIDCIMSRKQEWNGKKETNKENEKPHEAKQIANNKKC